MENQANYRGTRSATAKGANAVEKTKAAATSDPAWGRFNTKSWLGTAGCASIIAFCPILSILLWIAMDHHQGSLFYAAQEAFHLGLIPFAEKYAPTPSLDAFIGYTCWLIFQMTLYAYLPGKLGYGQLTPAGHLLPYTVNGLLAWFVTHVAAVSLVYAGVLDPALLAKHWAGLLVSVNIYGFLLSTFSYVKAHLFPTHADDRKFSGSIIYDFYMGVELNPRIGKLGDFKLFTNGRPGIVAWTLIDLSFAAYQYQLHGYVTYSMIVVIILHTIYVVDFFYNEDWYLRTIDICHDHFGFYLGWGSLVWLPTTYTNQTQYLARYPTHLPLPVALSILSTGLVGYYIFRSVNHQKDIVRRTDGNCMIWGKPAEYVRCTFKTSDGKTHESLLLCSGWWGWARQANYLGDLIISYSMCAVCGVNNLLPWYYAIFMTILLLHRINRNEMRSRGKYGKDWEAYCKKVPWKLLPGIY